ncbi:MAG: carbon monoxide dehydrogenase subunit G [Dehalococcoidia bacterium]|jgi:carbon monoxide dehydrogenase subunit G
MKIEGKFTMKAPIQKVWDFLLAPGTLASCIPGAEKMEAVDDTTWDGTVKQKVGPIGVKLNFTQKLQDIQAPTHLKAVGQGTAMGGAGTFTQETIVDMKELGGGEVEIAYSSNVNMVGRLATFGERIMRAKVNKVGNEFIENLQKKLKSHLGQ